MRLSDKEILEEISNGELVIVGTNNAYPFMNTQVQPCSIDLRLDNKFYKFKDNVFEFDISDIENVKNYFSYFEVQANEKITLQPNEVLFGQIYEQLRIPSDCSGMIEGRSRFARLGLSVHATGGFINPEFEGAMPLQIINNNKIPITIYPFINICQLILIRLTSKPKVPYPQRTNNPYHRERVASLSVLNRDNELSNSDVIHKEIEKRLLDGYCKEMEYRKLQRTLSPQVTIQHSTIGVLNAGSIEKTGKIETYINQLKHNGANDIATSIENIKEAILQSQELNYTIKEEVLEQLFEISEQANLPEEKRTKKSVLKAIFKGIGVTLNSVANLAKIWGTWGTNISAFFNF
ncbi:MAG: dCTP deaminase [Prevotellaceae bacterium]|jgi:deoxycytidine triphosphate deaminase|nr:dCTP deaminase [Prevotellaceae bacterium]